jgi:hypothetical protein
MAKSNIGVNIMKWHQQHRWHNEIEISVAIEMKACIERK